MAQDREVLAPAPLRISAMKNPAIMGGALKILGTAGRSDPRERFMIIIFGLFLGGILSIPDNYKEQVGVEDLAESIYNTRIGPLSAVQLLIVIWLAAVASFYPKEVFSAFKNKIALSYIALAVVGIAIGFFMKWIMGDEGYTTTFIVQDFSILIYFIIGFAFTRAIS